MPAMTLMPTDLSTLYSRVVKARADAAVTRESSMSGIPCLLKLHFYPEREWMLGPCRMNRDEAEALILRHWLGLLPKPSYLVNGVDGWYVEDSSGRMHIQHDSPLAAIAAFLESTHAK